MATHRSAELGGVFECDLSQGGLDEFEPEAERGAMWRRVTTPSAVDLLRWEPYVAPAHRRSWPFALPVVMAAAIAGAAVSWLGLRASDSSGVPAPPPPAARDVAAAPRAAPVVSEPLIHEASKPLSAPVAAHGEADLRVRLAALPMEPALEATLAAVSRSYRELDPSVLRAVWPGADTASLGQSFATLKYQSLSFERCETRANGAEGVLASCDVSIAAAPKSGDPALSRRRESWTLVLDRSGERWTIAGVSVRGDALSAPAIP